MPKRKLCVIHISHLFHQLENAEMYLISQTKVFTVDINNIIFVFLQSLLTAEKEKTTSLESSIESVSKDTQSQVRI